MFLLRMLKLGFFNLRNSLRNWSIQNYAHSLIIYV